MSESVNGVDLLISRFKWGVRYKDVMSGVLPFALFVTEDDAQDFLDSLSTGIDSGTPFELVEIIHVADGDEVT